MLTDLRVRQLAIIDELEVSFGEGLNIVTGETGAGKSILVAALGLVLGARGRPELVRTGAERAEVEALFDIREDADARARLEALGFETDAEIVVRRVVEAEGRTRATVNGRLTTITQLQKLAAGLVDISSQHEHHTLVDPATHLGYLDAYAGLADDRAQMEAAWGRWREATDAIERLRTSLREDRADLLRFQANELATAITEPELLAAHEAEASRLRNAVALADLTGRTEDHLQARDGAICAQLARVIDEVEDAARLDPILLPLQEQLCAALAEVEDVAQALGRYARQIHADPERLVILEEEAHQQKRLRRKYGDTLTATRAHIEAELAELEHAQDRLASLDEARERAAATAQSLAQALSRRRRAEAETLGAGITRELASLGMGEARVEVGVAEGGLTAVGVDRVEFLIATNRGEAPRPLRKVASGGELSRALLAVKRVLAAMGPVGTYVFDEVDSGVGGAVAEGIGQKLADVARHHQVVCITHLPQIAAYADRHFHVRKGTDGERTLTRIVRLAEPDRVEELARMLGGLAITDTTRAAARELIARRRA